MQLLLHLTFLCALVQFPNVIHGQGDNCPAEAYPCGSPSPLSNLLCYTYRKAQGLNYAFIGFGNGIMALCSINFKCAPAKESQLDVVDVLGFIIEPFPPNTTSLPPNITLFPLPSLRPPPLNLYYEDVSRGPTCPRVFPVRNPPFSDDGSRFDPALYPSPISTSLAYDIYLRTRQTYQGQQCNLFPYVEYDGCDDYCDGKKCCPPPVTSISLKRLKSVVFYSNVSAGDSAISRYLNNYGVCDVSCGKTPPQPGSASTFLAEPCASYAFNTSDPCRDYHNTVSLSQILLSYGYSRPTLGPREACEISTYNYQGPQNAAFGRTPTSSRYTTSFCTIAVVPQAVNFIYDDTDPESELLIQYALMEGYCENYIVDKIMQYFMDTC